MIKMSLDTNQSLRLPLIDFSVQPLKPKTPEWESVRSQVRVALEEFGCFEASFDKIPQDLRSEVFGSTLQDLFNLPLETKKLNVSNNPYNTYGYGESIKEENPHESMTIDNATVHKNVESFTDTLFPQGNHDLCKSLQSYTDQLSELDMIVRTMIFESLGIEKHLENHLDSTQYTLRVMKYEELEIGGEKKLSLQAHKDKRLINILGQNQVDGLEVQTKDGQWISGQLSKGSFMVILGEALSFVLANGRLHCPLHRVTIGLFSDPKKDYLIKTPEELVDEEHPLMFKPYYFSEYHKFMMANIKTIESSLKAYCGV